MPDPLAWIDEALATRQREGLQRSLIVRTTQRVPVDFSSNDYLGLAAHPLVVAAAAKAMEEYGWGAGASPLVSGWTQAHASLATELARFEHAEAVALFPTGYAANLATIAALVEPGDAVYLDRLNHASLIDGVKLSGASLRVYPHTDAERLRITLQRDRGRYRRSLIATDGVFSMDGDLAPLVELADLADEFEAVLLVDEAHGTGVFGADGRGAASHFGVCDRIPVRVGTLSKALGSVGGFVAGSQRLIDWLIHQARALIFSTSLPAAAAAAANAALQIVIAEPERRERLQALGEQLRTELARRGWGVPPSMGPIVPVMIGDPEQALAISSGLRDDELVVPAIRPPTVPRGTARLRISLTADHNPEVLAHLIRSLSRFQPPEPAWEH